MKVILEEPEAFPLAEEQGVDRIKVDEEIGADSLDPYATKFFQLSARDSRSKSDDDLFVAPGSEVFRIGQKFGHHSNQESRDQFQ